MTTEINGVATNLNVISEKTVKFIVNNTFKNKKYYIENFHVFKASDKVLGFLSDYFRLQIVVLEDNNNKRHVLNFFVKSISRNNHAKAELVKEMNLFEKELVFYAEIKKKINLPDTKVWSPELIAFTKNNLIFEDLTSIGYTNRCKYLGFDMPHILQALETLATFHSLSLTHDEKNGTNNIGLEFHKYLDESGFKGSSPWFNQCMTGGLIAIRECSKYKENSEVMNCIEQNWEKVWLAALSLSAPSSVHRNVISHRDLWNNNILFHYKEGNVDSEPDGCVLVDFQAIRYQPPAGDVMLMLYCNLDPVLREENMNMLLNYYYDELAKNLNKNDIIIEKIFSKNEFLLSAEEQRKWGAIVCACLFPLILADDERTKDILDDSDLFEEALTKDKGTVIIEMMSSNKWYKAKIMAIYDEIIERYCICKS